MPQTITTSSRSMVDAAKAAITELTPAEAVALASDPNVVFVDIRDPRELERDGKMPGAFACTRGMVEFWIDPASPYYKPIFGEDKRFVFFCGGGMRSALAAKVAQDMGLAPVAHIIDGFGGWKAAGGAVELSERARKSA
jgi:rhodanese-related sulfurtransferase